MLLTIDLGRNLGWTLGPLDTDAGPDQVSFSTETLSDTTDLGDFLRSADEPIRKLLRMPGIRLIAVEKPDTQGLQYFGIRKNMCLLGHVAYWSCIQGFAEPKAYSVTQAKNRLAGNGRADKDMMIAAARRNGYMVETEHEADALAIRLLHLFGPAPTKAEREKAAAAERREAKAAAKAAAKPGVLL